MKMMVVRGRRDRRSLPSLKALDLPFPAAIVLLKPEYEVLFLPCIESMAGQPLGNRSGIFPGAKWDRESWEARRGIKEWLTRQFPTNRSYKPTVDQLPMTRMIDVPHLRRANVPCFGTLERALAFLGENLDGGGVYP